MKFQDAIRFEFRLFGADLTRVRDAFAALGPSIEQPPSRETYIVSRLNIESNVKARRGRLEVKGLRGRLQNLEQWQPVLASELPVTADEADSAVIEPLPVHSDLAARCGTTRETVARAISDLIKKGVAEKQGNGLRIADLWALKDIVEGGGED